MNKTILIIDNDSALVDLMKVHLSAEGFSVLLATNGDDGINLAKFEQPNLIILDALMPKMSGYVVAALLKKDTTTAHIPLLLLTESQPLQMGIPFKSPTPYQLQKPINLDKLINLTLNILK